MSQAQPVSKWVTKGVQTSATGANFVQLPAQNCDEITIVNPSVGIDVQSPQGSPELGANDFISIAANSGITLQVAGNAQEVLVRRTDQLGTQIYIKYIARQYRN